MDEKWAGLGAAWLVALAVIGLLGVSRAVRVRFDWLAAALAIFVLNALALFYMKPLFPLSALFGELHWNWGGKIGAILVSLLVAAALWRFAKQQPADMGLTLAQRKGSTVPALLAIAVLIGIGVGVQLWSNDGPQADPERLLYQATMPGLDEELVWRGTLLLALGNALAGPRLNLLGAQIGWNGAIVTLLFGLMHGLALREGAWTVDYLNIVITGVLGFGFLWIRERTGSVVLPIVAHNAVNVTISLI